MARFTADAGFGGTIQVGILTAAMNVLSFIGGLLFVKIFKLCGRFLPFVSLLLIVLGFFMMSISQNFTMVLLAVSALGIGLGLMFPFFFATMSIIAPKKTVDTSMSLISCAMYLGIYLSSLFLEWIELLTNAVDRTTFSVTGLLFVAIAIVVLLLTITSKRYKHWYAVSFQMESPEDN
ncbi:MAG: MFS transporter [Eubacteriales bacterium]|nr:MFS transporter [Eubacteriales bacterium]